MQGFRPHRSGVSYWILLSWLQGDANIAGPLGSLYLRACRAFRLAMLSSKQGLYMVPLYIFKFMQEVCSQRMRHCGRCKFAKYCSPECQLQHWPEHRRECRSISSIWHIGVRRRRRIMYGFMSRVHYVLWQLQLRQLERSRQRMRRSTTIAI